MSNQLRYETSLYLRQHAENPVDWYPYSQAAFITAQRLNKPIFLSVGYSACHWCHVMAHESFEDPATAEIMNQHFINIKVDREEHPEIDAFYQQAYQRMNRQAGGWPLSLFLTPTGKPFFGGTYFPRESRYGLPAFRQLLEAVAMEYQREADSFKEYAEKIVGSLSPEEVKVLSDKAIEPDQKSLKEAASLVHQAMDVEEGGLKGALKFPNVPVLSFLLQAGFYYKEPKYTKSVLHTLEKIAHGGIYDQLGGGFSRYSTDSKWRVPHFEKMLYDQGLLIRLYAEAYQAARALDHLEQANLFAKKVSQTIDWLTLEMRDPQGAFYAAQDADSEGVEGKYYVFTQEEIVALCTHNEAQVFCRCYGITKEGNFPHGQEFGLAGAHVLYMADRPRTDEELQLLQQAKAKVLAARKIRVPPATDRKILTSWNGLLLSALAIAARVFQEQNYLSLAKSLAHFFIEKGLSSLQRNYQDGATPLPATLDDYAFLAEGFFHLASTASESVYLEKSRFLTEQILTKFYRIGEHYLTMADPNEQLLPFALPLVQEHDSAVPSGASVACLQFLRLADLVEASGRRWYLECVEKILNFSGNYTRNPLAFSGMCSALELNRYGMTTVVFSPSKGGTSSLSVEEFVKELTFVYVPELFIFCWNPEKPLGAFQNTLGDKPAIPGRTSAYVCKNQKCYAPAFDSKSLQVLLLSETMP